MIEKCILPAYSNLSRLMCEIHLYQHNEILSLGELSRLTNLQSEKSQICIFMSHENELDLAVDSDEEIRENDQTSFQDESYEEDSCENNDDLTMEWQI